MIDNQRWFTRLVLLLMGILAGVPAVGTASPAGLPTEPAKSGTSVRFDQPTALNLRVSLNKLSFRDGEEVRITVQANQPVYVHVFSVAENGSVTALLPNRIVRGNLVMPGQDLVFPSDSLRELGVRMQVLLPKGALRTIEQVKVVATREKVELLKGESLDGVFYSTGGEGNRFLETVHQKLIALGPDNWTETSLSYEIRKGSRREAGPGLLRPPQVLPRIADVVLR
ncbi:DUF4384 domain-containing protein [Nitrospira sp. Kam-Ns4a]